MRATGRKRVFEVVAGATWLAVVLCAIAQGVTQWRMRTSYSLLRDAVSDLGATSCTPAICSPWAWFVNVSFLLLGLCLIGGGVLAHLSSPTRWRVSRWATIALVLGGIGMCVVGAVPENVLFPLHAAGAVLGLVGGNVGAALAGWALVRVRQHHLTGRAAIVVGAVGVLAAIVSIAVFAGWLPPLVFAGGGVERLAVEPMLAVLMLSGGALLLGEDLLLITWLSAERAQRRAMTRLRPRH